MSERQPGGIGNGFAEWRTASDVDRTARQPKFREHHRGNVRTVHKAVRVEEGGSVKAPEEHLPTSILETRALPGQVGARQSLRSRVTLDRRAPRIKFCYPIIGTHPKAAVVIFEDAAHCIAREAIPPRVGDEPARRRVKLIQPVLGTYPHSAGTIKVHRVHPVVAQGPGTTDVVFVLGELPGRWIETV